MPGRTSVSNTCLFLLLVTAALAVCVSGYNDDRPIFKWSPNFFNDFYPRRSYKRHNEDMPFYKWSPRWFYRNAGLYKRSVPEPFSDGLAGVCATEGSRCGAEPSGDRLLTCCGPLRCLVTTDGNRCQSPARLRRVSAAAGAGGSDPAAVVGADWYRNAPPPFFPRS